MICILLQKYVEYNTSPKMGKVVGLPVGAFELRLQGKAAVVSVEKGRDHISIKGKDSLPLSLQQSSFCHARYIFIVSGT